MEVLKAAYFLGAESNWFSDFKNPCYHHVVISREVQGTDDESVKTFPFKPEHYSLNHMFNFD